MSSFAPARTVEAADSREITAEQARKWIEAGLAVLVDVREPDEHARERIAGSVLMPLSRFDVAAVGARADSTRRIILHCKAGKRSADAAGRCGPLSQQGVSVLSLAGGIDAWKSAGLPTLMSRAAPHLSIMRQVQLTVGILTLAGSAAAWFVNPAWIGVPAFLGAGLTFAGATGTCALASLLGTMPWNKLGGAPSCASTFRPGPQS